MYAKPPTIFEFATIIHGKEVTEEQFSFLGTAKGQWISLVYPTFLRDPFNWVNRIHGGYLPKGLSPQKRSKLIAPYLSAALAYGLDNDDVDFP